MSDRNEKEAAMSGIIKASLLEPVILAAAGLALTGFMGDSFAGMLGSSFVIFFGFYGVFMIALRRRIARVVKMYRNNLFLINAVSFAKASLYKSAAVFISAAIALILFGNFLSVNFTGSPKTRLLLYACALLIILTCCLSEVLGFIEGMGRTKTVMILDIIRAFLSCASACLCSVIGFFYGKKLDALLYTADTSQAYAGCAFIIGLCFSWAVILLAAFLIKKSILKKLSPLHENSKPEFKEKKMPLFRYSWPFMLTLSVIPLVLMASGAFLCESASSGLNVTETLGVFYGHCAPFVFITSVLCAFPFIKRGFDFYESLNRRTHETRDVQERRKDFYKLLRLESLLFFPAGTFITVLSSDMEGGFFLLINKTAILLLSFGGMLSTLISFAITTTLLFVLLKRYRPLMLCAVSALVISLIADAVTILGADAGIYGVTAALYAAFALFDIMGIFMLKSLFGIKSLLILRMMLKPLIMSVFAALAVLVLSEGVRYLIGEINALIISVLAGSVIYLILMAMFRGIEKDELRGIPGGALLERISMRGM